MPLIVLLFPDPLPALEGRAGPCRAREPPCPGRGPGGSAEFPVLPPSQAFPGLCPGFPGEGSRAPPSSGGCCATPEPRTVPKGKEAKRRLERTG